MGMGCTDTEPTYRRRRRRFRQAVAKTSGGKKNTEVVKIRGKTLWKLCQKNYFHEMTEKALN